MNLAAATLLYASGRHQSMLAQRLPKLVVLPVSGGLLVGALYLVNLRHDITTALFTTVVVLMASLSLLPLVTAYLRSLGPRA